MRKFICAFLALFMLTGCHKAKESIQEQTANNTASMNSFDDSYYKIVKFDDSELREDFYLDYGSTNDFQSVGRGLQLISNDYFSTSNHYMSEGQYLKLSLVKEMLSRKSENSLQPESGRVIENIESPVMVQNLQEQDYYIKDGDRYTLKGLAFAIVIDPRKSDNTRLDVAMSDKEIVKYGRECIEKFYKVIQNSDDFKNVKNIPVLITVYQATDKTTSTVNGHYILKSYCQNELGEISNVNQETVLFVSERAQQIDKTTSNDFDTIKAGLKNAATEAAGFVGEAKYVNGEIQSMVINVHLNVKTATELMYLTSIVADGIESKFTYDFDTKVLIYSQDELSAIIVKEKGKSAKSYSLE
ncbi:CamS family sex pheromone protein [Candidatus Stoquefichus massiliensis]|uniref:CamS family sex pheromone protein n=1 Tax=Candidatus Stoquefichus massiliensis TaxID=1470350 RepID=UPI00047F2FE7|nr:CamS family sex pheromone protein [Candidatus Stoquefichus massiliensis]